jgi:hypothetical protein
MNNSGVWRRMTFLKNVVNRGKRWFFRQVIEKAKKIILQKCPSYRMQYDIMIL